MRRVWIALGLGLIAWLIALHAGLGPAPRYARCAATCHVAVDAAAAAAAREGDASPAAVPEASCAERPAVRDGATRARRKASRPPPPPARFEDASAAPPPAGDDLLREL